MTSNLEKYKKDLDNLISRGDNLCLAIQFECFPEDFESRLDRLYKGKKGKAKLISGYKELLPSFNDSYQKWYSESLSLVTQLLPERAEDFFSFYKKPKTHRKDITYENYTIEDALLGLEVSRTDQWEGKKIIADKKAAIPKFKQQINIVKSIKNRFESSLYDIKQLVQADLYDSELDSAKELNKKGFTRGAGAVAGVVLEGHLMQVCQNHKIAVRKKNPSINDYAQLLKDNKVIETPVWRKIQHLTDLRNLCDHKKESDPSTGDIEELIVGVNKIVKNIF